MLIDRVCVNKHLGIACAAALTCFRVGLAFRGDLQNTDQDNFRFLSWTDLLVSSSHIHSGDMHMLSFFWYFE